MRGLFALGFLVSSAAFGQTVTSSYLPGVDFSKYHTYKWAATRPHPTPEIDVQIRQTIESELAKKGLSKTESKPDLTLDYHVAVSTKEQWTSFRYNELDSQSPQLITVYAGTLGLDIKDPSLNQVVWTGVVTKAMHPDAPRGTKLSNLNKAVQSLLRGFPPPKPRG
jgi:hypothetical protein